MKKTICLVTIFVLLLTLVACGKNEDSTNSITNENISSPSMLDTVPVKEDVTDVKVDYTAPNVLSDNFMDYTFRLEGELYALPVPVSEFVNNGWEISEYIKSIPANETKTLLNSLMKDELRLTIEVKNFSSVEKEIDDVMVTGIWITESDVNKGVDFELSGGIKPGVSVNEFKAANDISKFTEEALSTGGTEYSHFEPSNRVYLTFKEDKLVEISAKKIHLRTKEKCIVLRYEMI